MENNKKNIIYIIVGIVVLAVIFYLATTGSGNFKSSSLKDNQQTAESANLNNAQQLVNEKGEVLAPSGEVAKNDAPVGSLEAPAQSSPLKEEEVPEDSIKLEVKDNKIIPETFKVKAGQVVKLSFSSKDGKTHIFKFEDPSLAGIAIGIGAGETRMIFFNAPDKKGEYNFYCDVPGHKGIGEFGKMIVE